MTGLLMESSPAQFREANEGIADERGAAVRTAIKGWMGKRIECECGRWLGWGKFGADCVACIDCAVYNRGRTFVDGGRVTT